MLSEIKQPTKFMSGKDDKQSVRPYVLVTKNQSIYLILDWKLCSVNDFNVSVCLIIISHSSDHWGATSAVMKWCRDSFTLNRNSRNPLGIPRVYCACTMKSCFTYLYLSPLGTQMKSISVSALLVEGGEAQWWFLQPHRSWLVCLPRHRQPLGQCGGQQHNNADRLRYMVRNGIREGYSRQAELFKHTFFTAGG